MDADSGERADLVEYHVSHCQVRQVADAVLFNGLRYSTDQGRVCNELDETSSERNGSIVS